MAKAEYADLVKTVSGALTKINKKSQHAADMKMVLATHRVAATNSRDCSRIYLRGLSSVTRNTPFTSRERDIHNRFSAVATAVANRLQDLTQITQDQLAFNAQKNTPGGKKTMKSYLWSLEMATYDAAHPQP